MERGSTTLVRGARRVGVSRHLSGAPGRAARAPDTQLAAYAREYGSPALHASAAQARAAVQLAEGRADGAVPSLRRACKLWQEVQLPYETATARALLAAAYRATGCPDDAELERQAATSTFTSLGADLATASALSGQALS